MRELVALYEAGDEDARMVSVTNRVEWERTLELLGRWLPAAPARVLDVGGGPGRYAAWLVERGYDVALLDPVPQHVEQARARGVDAQTGDARALPFGDDAADAVLVLGPLYHLPVAADRALALAEAVRCAAPGAPVVVAAMSRWAKPVVKTVRGELGDPAVRGYLLRVMAHGRDPEGDAFDLVSYNHDPDELRAELVAAGLTDVQVLGIEGPLGAQARLDASLADTAVTAARIAEARAPHLSIHLLARGVTARL
jgi:ubiquinone/menaquinone biosynthesis C-methylase UbiE